MRQLFAGLALLGAVFSVGDAAACNLKGRARVDKGTLLRGPGGDTVARFSGSTLSLSVSLDGSAAKAKTGDGFRVEGAIDLGGVWIFTKKNLPVVVDHVWIAGGRRVSARLDGGTIMVEQKAGAPIDQTLKAKAECAALSLEPVSFTHPAIPETARGFVAKKAPLSLRESPGGAEIFSLTSDNIKDALLFFSTERRGSSVRVLFAADVVIDAWASASDLEALKLGEMLGASSVETTIPGGPKLAFDGSVRKLKAAREAAMRDKPDDKAVVIGAVEADTEVLVLETVLGWSNVLPASLALQPPEGKGFWVKLKDLEGK